MVAHEYKEHTRIGEQSKHLGDGSTVSYRPVVPPNKAADRLSPFIKVTPDSAFVQAVAQDQTDPATLITMAA